MKSLVCLLSIVGTLAGCGGGPSGGDAPAPSATVTPGPGPAPAPFSQRVARGDFDYDANGVPDATEEFSYDAYGRQTQRRFAYAGDGTSDRATPEGVLNKVQDSTYDNAGKLLTEVESRADGTSSRTTLQYDPTGVLTRMDTVALNASNEVVSQGYFLYTYVAGRLNEMVFHLSDGTPLMRQTLAYGTDGFPATVVSTNLLVPAALNSRTEYNWNSDATIRAKRFDANNDGVFEEVIAYDYAAGRLIRSVKAHGGTYTGLAGAATYDFTYNIAGHLARIDTDLNNNGSIDTMQSVVFAAGACSPVKIPLLLPLVTGTGYGSSATGNVTSYCAPVVSQRSHIRTS